MKKYLVLCAFLPIFACNKDDDKPSNQLWPLAVGNTWIYDYQSYYEDGTPGSSFKDTNVVTGVAARAGYFVLNGDDEQQIYSSETEVKGYDAVANIETVYYRKSDRIDTFNIFVDSYGDKNVFIAHPGTEVVLNHTCIKVEHLVYIGDRLSDRFFDYISPGIGLVRSDYYLAPSGDDMYFFRRRDLISYKLNK